jgi:SAM-dependent methyltransferase
MPRQAVKVSMLEITRAFAEFKQAHNRMPEPATILPVFVDENENSLADFIRDYQFKQYDSPGFNSALQTLIDRGFSSNGSCLYDISLFSRYARPARQHLGRIPATTLQIGPGGSLGCEVLFTLAGVREAYTIDPFPLMTFDLDNFLATLQPIAMLQSFLGAGLGSTGPNLSIPPSSTIAKGDYRVGESIIRHIYPRSFEETGFPDASVEFLYSHATMEHVRDPLQCIRETRRVLRPGGLTAHCIDLRDHRNFDRPLGFLRESRETWQAMMNEYCKVDGSGYLNRWRAHEFRAAFEAEGFEILEVVPEIKATEEMMAPDLPHLDATYRNLPREELEIISMSIVARKKA